MPRTTTQANPASRSIPPKSARPTQSKSTQANLKETKPKETKPKETTPRRANRKSKKSLTESPVQTIEPKPIGDIRLSRKETPWGESQQATDIAPGITFHSTASHGGFYLYAETNKKIPHRFKSSTVNAQGMRGWYEEDCDAAIVIYFFKEYFSEAHYLSAIESLQEFHSAPFKSFQQNRL